MGKYVVILNYCLGEIDTEKELELFATNGDKALKIVKKLIFEEDRQLRPSLCYMWSYFKVGS